MTAELTTMTLQNAFRSRHLIINSSMI